MSPRYVTPEEGKRIYARLAGLYPTPLDDGMEEAENYRLYRLCPCENCAGTGRYTYYDSPRAVKPLLRCKTCRGEGRSLELVATATDAASVGVALVTLASEGEWDECPFGLMHRPEGQTGKWLLRPWTPSARNVSDAARTLARSKKPNIPS